MVPHLKALNLLFSLQVFANTQDSELLKLRGLNLSIEFVPVVRKIRPLVDLKALWCLYKRLRQTQPKAVHTLTPKAGLLGMAAAKLAGVPVRVHSFTGQVWVTRAGLMRLLLKTADKCIAALATDVLIDSPSQRDFLITHGIVSSNKSRVLGSGSICGVDMQRFCPQIATRQAMRTKLGTTDDAIVCLYLGRLNRDKGVLDLATAFAQVASKYPNVELWVVGPDEENIFDQMQLLLSPVKKQVRRVGFTQEPERFMQAADLFCLPSYREGFGSSVIEAAACGVPALASRIYGLTDAVIEGKTGWLHTSKDVNDLTKCLTAILSMPLEISIRGSAAKTYVCQEFSMNKVTKLMVEFYQDRLR